MANSLNFVEIFFEKLASVTGSIPFVGTVFLVSAVFKIFLLGLSAINHKRNIKLRRSLCFLNAVLFCSLIHDSSWVLYVIKNSIYPGINIIFYRAWLRMAWACYCMQYQAMVLFIESLIYRDYKIGVKQKIFLGISASFFILYLCILPILRGSQFSLIESWAQFSVYWYILFPLTLPMLLAALYKIHHQELPRILDGQLKLLVVAIIIPSWLFDALSLVPFKISAAVTNNGALTSLTNTFLTFAMFYCARRIIGLRFLNSQDHIAASYKALTKLTFFVNFKHVVKQFGTAMTMRELHHITQNFFTDSFYITQEASSLYPSNPAIAGNYQEREASSKITNFVEDYLRNGRVDITQAMWRSKIFIYDEICFTNFYEPSIENDVILTLMDKLNADIFLPIYDKNIVMGYIIVAKAARNGVLYTDVDRDQMIIFASYLGHLINLIVHKNIDILLEQYTAIKHDLHEKTQELFHYKESLDVCIRSQKYKEIGIVFYKTNRFVFGNKEAHDMIKINPNVAAGSPLTKDLKRAVRQVCLYKIPYRIFSKNSEGATLVLSAIPQLDTNGVLVTVFYPEISDIIKKQASFLKDSSQWEYPLYLETTEIGKKINTMIPGTGEHLLTFKIELLKAAMSSRAVLLNVPEGDSVPLAQLLHTLSCRQDLFTLEFTHRVKDRVAGIELFGANPLFGKSSDEPPLLEKLSKKGTLFIQNIHFLDLESQEIIADFIQHGFFRSFHGNQRKASSVRIIASSSENLIERVQEGSFSRNLYDALCITKINLPLLTEFSPEELGDLVDGYSYLAGGKSALVHPGRLLTDTDKKNLINQRPLSLQELRLKVHYTLNRKPVMLTSDDNTQEFLLEVSQAGKRALQDKETLARLLKIFGSQVRIAEFLCINRSSVSRRCREYGLE